MNASFVAFDRGGGVYRSLIKVDGKVVKADVVDSNGGACRDLVAGGDPYDGFARAVPCELTASVSAVLDTAVVPNGSHQLSIEVEDAAGNRSVAFPPTTFRFSNGSGAGSGSSSGPSGPNGVNATDQARIVFEGTTKTRYRLRYGRAVTIGGRLLTPSGQPIQGATMDVIEQLSLQGEPARRVATVRTDERGGFSYLAPAGPSRVLNMAYTATLPASGASPAIDYDARQRVELMVGAGLRMKVTPRRARNLQTLRFKGSLLGAPLPPQGKLILIQAQVKRSGRVRWQTFLSAQTDSSGAFRGKYQLTRSRTATGYRFRAVAPRAGDYPYGTGASKVAKVRIVR